MFKVRYRVEGSEDWSEIHYMKREDAVRWCKMLDREEGAEYTIYEGQWKEISLQP